jgi:hypothetical protein
MIRPVTCVCLLMAAGSGLYLYQAKHQAQVIDREITRTMNEVSRLSQRISVLRADYQLEQDPETLGALAQQYLADLKPTAPSQFTTWAELEKLLPPPPSAPAAEAVAPQDVPAAGAEPPRPAVTAEPARAEPAGAEPPRPAVTPEPARAEPAGAEPPRPSVAPEPARAEPPRPAAAPEPAHAEATRTEPPPQRPTAMRPTVPPVAATAMAPLLSPAPAPTATASRQVGHSLVAVARQAPATPAPAPVSAGQTLPSAGAATVRMRAPLPLAPSLLGARATANRPQPSVLFAARPSASVAPPAYIPNGFAQTSPAAPPMVASALGMARAMLKPVAVAPASAATNPTPYRGGNEQ